MAADGSLTAADGSSAAAGATQLRLFAAAALRRALQRGQRGVGGERAFSLRRLYTAVASRGGRFNGGGERGSAAAASMKVQHKFAVMLIEIHKKFKLQSTKTKKLNSKYSPACEENSLNKTVSQYCRYNAEVKIR